MTDATDDSTPLRTRALARIDRIVADGQRRLYHTGPVQWFLFRGNRRLVTVALLGCVFVTFVLLSLLRPLDVERLLSDTTTLRTLFTTLLSGAILLVSVVSSISSIVLSQEISDIETEQERIDASLEFRSRTESLAEIGGSPGQPAAFLEVVLYTIYRATTELREVGSRSDDPEFRDRIEKFTAEIISDAKEAATTLDGAKFGTFKVLSAGMSYDQAWQLNTARRIQNQYGDSLTDEEAEVLSELIDTLKLFATGREYFQSLYYKREVARLSSFLLYATLPVIVFISYLLLALDENLIIAFSIGPLSSLSLFVLFAYTVSLIPYVILTAYVVRVAAITLQTMAAGPFTVRQRDHEDIVDLQMETDPEQWDAEPDGGGRADGERDRGQSGPDRSEPADVAGEGETGRGA